MIYPKYFITMEDTGDFWCSTAYMGNPSNPSFIPDSRKTPDGGGVPPEENFNKNSQTRYELRPDGTAILNQSDNSIFRGRVFNYNASRALGVNTLDWWGLHLGSQDWYPNHSSTGTVGIYLGTEDNSDYGETCVPAVIRPATSTNGCCTNGHLIINNGITVTDTRPDHMGDSVSINTDANGEITFFTSYSGGGGLSLTVQADGLHSYGTPNDGHFIVNQGSGGVALYPNSLIMAPPSPNTPNVSHAVFDAGTCRYPNIESSETSDSYIGFESAVRAIVRSEVSKLGLVNSISVSSTGSTPITNVSWTFYH